MPLIECGYALRCVRQRESACVLRLASTAQYRHRRRQRLIGRLNRTFLRYSKSGDQLLSASPSSTAVACVFSATLVPAPQAWRTCLAACFSAVSVSSRAERSASVYDRGRAKDCCRPAVTPLIDALAQNPEFPGQNSDVLTSLNPARASSLKSRLNRLGSSILEGKKTVTIFRVSPQGCAPVQWRYESLQ
jgi:hypothetical protein